MWHSHPFEPHFMALQAALGQPGVTVAAGPMGRAAMVGGFPFLVAKKTVEKKAPLRHCLIVCSSDTKPIGSTNSTERRKLLDLLWVMSDTFKGPYLGTVLYKPPRRPRKFAKPPSTCWHVSHVLHGSLCTLVQLAWALRAPPVPQQKMVAKTQPVYNLFILGSAVAGVPSDVGRSSPDLQPSPCQVSAPLPRPATSPETSWGRCVPCPLGHWSSDPAACRDPSEGSPPVARKFPTTHGHRSSSRSNPHHWGWIVHHWRHRKTRLDRPLLHLHWPQRWLLNSTASLLCWSQRDRPRLRCRALTGNHQEVLEASPKLPGLVFWEYLYQYSHWHMNRKPVVACQLEQSGAELQIYPLGMEGDWECGKWRYRTTSGSILARGRLHWPIRVVPRGRGSCSAWRLLRRSAWARGYDQHLSVGCDPGWQHEQNATWLSPDIWTYLNVPEQLIPTPTPPILPFFPQRLGCPSHFLVALANFNSSSMEAACSAIPSRFGGIHGQVPDWFIWVVITHLVSGK